MADPFFSHLFSVWLGRFKQDQAMFIKVREVGSKYNIANKMAVEYGNWNAQNSALLVNLISSI
jgi:hypothetical protein